MIEGAPLPWRSYGGTVWSAKEGQLLDAVGRADLHAVCDHVAHVVNCYDDMLEALRLAEKTFATQEQAIGRSIGSRVALVRIRGALALANNPPKASHDD